MAYTALYRKWRPKNFSEVVGQEHISETLKNQITGNRIAHAYLFAGTRGTGKTSTAKIFAKAVNCLNSQNGEPCNECEMCKKIASGTAIDVEELDAASHRGIDKMKEIIDTVQYHPRESKYKIYILDEVHMLTTEAVNAFLKTLEEPPKNVIFILATTDPQKLPITILSRCQRFDFKRIKSSAIFNRLRYIAKEQGVLVDDKSLNLVSRICDGAMRDALSILDQAIAMENKKIDYMNLITMLGLVSKENLFKLTDAIIDKNIEQALKVIDYVVFDGKDINNFIKDFINHMRNLLVVKISQNPEEVLDMSQEDINMTKEQSNKIRMENIMRNINILQEAEEQSKWSKQSRVFLELATIKMCKVEYDTSKEILLSRINKLEEIIKSGNIVINNDNTNNTKQEISNKELSLKVKKEPKEEVESYNHELIGNKITLEQVKKSWKDILEIFKSRRMMVIYASLVTGKVIDCKNNIIDILYDEEYSFNKKRLEKSENKKNVDMIFSEALKAKVRIRYIIDKKEIDTRTPEQILKDTFGEDKVDIIDE